jgi:hypothetical protein
MAARFSISSNDNSLSQVKLMRPSNRWNSARICSSQYFSMGESPMTTATLAVPGSTRRIFSMVLGKSLLVATTTSFSVMLMRGIRRWSTAVNRAGVEGKSSFRCRWKKLAAGAPKGMTKLSCFLAKRAGK